MKKERFKIVPSCYLILVDNNKTLLGLRQNTGYEDGKYGLVAGHVEAGESVIKGLIRETREEIGIELDPQYIRHVRTQYRMSADERADFFFIAEKWQGEITNCEPHKCISLEWFLLTNLPENTIPYIRYVLDATARGEIYSEFGW